MKRLLVISDTHIPDRARWVPQEALVEIERQGPYDVAIHAGDLTSEDVLDWVKTLAPQVVVVEGNMDYLPLPKHQMLEVEGVKIGVHHGHGVFPRGNVKKLTKIAESLGVRVLVSGHTHAPFVKEYGGVLHINPGSLTGAWGGAGGTMRPSFCVVEVASGSLKVKLFERRGGVMVLVQEIAWP